MPIDPSIALQVQAPQNPLAQFAQVAQIQGLQNQNRLADLQFQKFDREQQDKNKLAQLLSGEYKTPQDREEALIRGGFVEQGLKFGTDRRANEKTDVETAAKRFETTSKKLDIAGQAFGFVKSNPTPAAAAQTLDYLEANGIYTKQEADRYRQMITQDPSSIPTLAEQAFRSVLSAKDQLAKYETQNLGGTSRISAIDPVTGRAATVSETAITQSADNKASNETSRANNAATVAASLANASATRAIAQATRDAADIKDRRDTEMKFADDYRTQSKAFKEVSDAYKQIGNTLDKATTSPAATLAGATKFMKLLDPGSVVRESELGMALQASGVLDRATNYYQTLLRGKVLTPTQVADFKTITGEIYKAAQDQQRVLDADYKRKAEGNRLRPDMIIQDLGQNAKPGAPAPGSPDPLGLRK